MFLGEFPSLAAAQYVIPVVGTILLLTQFGGSSEFSKILRRGHRSLDSRASPKSLSIPTHMSPRLSGKVFFPYQ